MQCEHLIDGSFDTIHQCKRRAKYEVVVAPSGAFYPERAIVRYCSWHYIARWPWPVIAWEIGPEGNQLKEVHRDRMITDWPREMRLIERAREKQKQEEV